MSPHILRKTSSLALLTAYVSAFSMDSRAGENAWTTVGPHGGSASQIYFDPVDPTLAYARTFQAVYKSVDAGKTWAEIDLDAGGSRLSGIAIDPSRSRRLYAASFGGLFRSDDAGVTFQKLPGVPGNTPDMALGAAGPVEISVSRSGMTLYVSATTGPSYVSTDGGVTFSPRAETNARNTVRFDPANESVFYATNVSEFFRSPDGAATWISAPSPNFINLDLAVTGTPALTAWTPTSAGIVSSTDNGAHWAQSLAVDYPWLSQDPNMPEVLYAGSSHNPGPVFRYANGNWQQLPGALPAPGDQIAQPPANTSTLLAAGGVELNRSDDGGASWTRSDKGIMAWYPLALGASRSRMYVGATGWNFASTENAGEWRVGRLPTSEAIYAGALSIAADPGDADYVLAGTSEGMARSTDGGANWTALGTALAGDSTDVRVEGIAFNPANPLIVYATHGKGSATRILRSTDHGATFQFVGDDLPAIQRVTSFVADKHKAGHLLLTGTDFQQLSGMFRSTDGGVHWTQVLTRSDIVNVAIDATNGNRMYAPTAGPEGLLMSDDGGATWKGVPGFNLSTLGLTWDVAADPQQSGVVYAISVKYGPPVNIWWLLRSVDGGETWEKVEAPAVRNWQPQEIAIAPDTPSIVYMSTWYRGVYSVELAPDLNVVIQSHIGQKTLNAANQFSVAVHNNGPFAATGMSLSITLPSSTQGISATMPNGQCDNRGNVVICTASYVKNGQDAVASVTYTPTVAGAMEISTSVSARERDRVPENNAVTATATVVAASSGGNSGGTGNSSSSGGGGALSVPFVLLLASIQLASITLRTRARRLRGTLALRTATSP